MNPVLLGAFAGFTKSATESTLDGSSLFDNPAYKPPIPPGMGGIKRMPPVTSQAADAALDRMREPVRQMAGFGMQGTRHEMKFDKNQNLKSVATPHYMSPASPGWPQAMQQWAKENPTGLDPLKGDYYPQDAEAWWNFHATNPRALYAALEMGAAGVDGDKMLTQDPARLRDLLVKSSPPPSFAPEAVRRHWSSAPDPFVKPTARSILDAINWRSKNFQQAHADLNLPNGDFTKEEAAYLDAAVNSHGMEYLRKYPASVTRFMALRRMTPSVSYSRDVNNMRRNIPGLLPTGATSDADFSFVRDMVGRVNAAPPPPATLPERWSDRSNRQPFLQAWRQNPDYLLRPYTGERF